MTPFDLELHVDEMVLEGVDPAHRETVANAMRAELAALLARGGVRADLLRGGALRLEGGSLTVEPGLAPAELGARIARAVHSGMGAPPSRDGGAKDASTDAPTAGSGA
jgi:hypothetical protein